MKDQDVVYVFEFKNSRGKINCCIECDYFKDSSRSSDCGLKLRNGFNPKIATKRVQECCPLRLKKEQ